MKLDGIYSSTDADSAIGAAHQGICPDGWHVPVDANNGGEGVGTSLKSDFSAYFCHLEEWLLQKSNTAATSKYSLIAYK